MPNEYKMRQSFQFTVDGPLQAGTIYVTLTYKPADHMAVMKKATKLAAKRSGDPEPRFVRSVNPRR